MKRIILFPLVIILLFSCRNEGSEKGFTYENLIGKWELIEAKREGSITKSLDGSYFEFMADSSLKTNIPGMSDMGKVYLKGNMIVTADSKINDFSYEILDSTNKNLLLETEIRDYSFSFKVKQ